jgi:hypothetical protein
MYGKAIKSIQNTSRESNLAQVCIPQKQTETNVCATASKNTHKKRNKIISLHSTDAQSRGEQPGRGDNAGGVGALVVWIVEQRQRRPLVLSAADDTLRPTVLYRMPDTTIRSFACCQSVVAIAVGQWLSSENGRL